MSRVARAFGPDWVSVYTQPFEVTLMQLMALEDVERIDGLVERGQRLDNAFLMNAAFAGGAKGKPHPLTEANRKYLAELRRAPRVATRQEQDREAMRDLLLAIAEANAAQATGAAPPAEVT